VLLAVLELVEPRPPAPALELELDVERAPPPVPPLDAVGIPCVLAMHEPSTRQVAPAIDEVKQAARPIEAPE
jgi:hypothetical protein